MPVQIIPNTAKDDDDVTDDTEEDDDLDAPPSQKSTKGFKTTSSTTNAESPSPAMPRNTGFRIGGRLKQATETPPLARGQEPDGKHDDLPVRHSPSSPPAEAVEASPKKVKKGFKIGGKGKTSTGEGSQTVAPDVRPEEGDHVSRPNDAKTASSPLTRTDEEESMAEEPAREETAEEKAERRRAELKRKTDEAAKKQGQQKKKRRF